MDIPGVLSALRAESDEALAPLFYTMEDLWERKLWHQLTETVVELFRDERSRNVRFRLFNEFVTTFERHVNKLAYVTLGIVASETCDNPRASLEFLENIAKTVDNDDTRAVYVYAQLRISSINLQLGQQVQAKKLLDAAAKQMDTLQIADQVIKAAYYGAACEFFKAKANYSDYYRNALLYLACIDLNELPETTQRQRAYDLAVAALLGDQIYNFGGLILHPVFSTLKGEYQWLHDLVLAVNAGDISGFQALQPQLAKAPVLEKGKPFLEQKICLMAFCECVFKRPTAERTLDFDTIAKETYLHSGSKVEVLVLKAFSLGLAKGSIDQIERTVTVSWLQPRVLDRDQMITMRDKLAQWDGEVELLGQWMHKEGQDVWVQ